MDFVFRFMSWMNIVLTLKTFEIRVCEYPKLSIRFPNWIVTIRKPEYVLNSVFNASRCQLWAVKYEP